MDLSSFQNLDQLDLNDVGSWPLPIKVVAIVLVAAAVLGLGYYFDTQKQIAELEKLEKKEQELRADFVKKKNKAVNLPLYKEQMKEMERSFGAMLRQLPGKNEVADLLVDVSQTGLANGLEFQLFKPRDEARKEFYAELPITIRVTGSFHEFGKFVSDVAALPRIVTLQDIAIKPTTSGKDANARNLTMDAIAKTYRYLEEDQ